MAFPTLKVEQIGAIVTVTLNRPEKLNAINAQMHQDLQAVCAQLRDDLDTRVVILTGAGRAFTAGADLSESGTAPTEPVQARRQAQTGMRTSAALEGLEQITIAAVNGLAIGGGVVFSLCCDLRLAAESAWFSIPEVNLGLPWTWNALPRLVREVGPSRALELVSTGDRFSAQQALEWGMVNYVVHDAELLQAAEALAGKIAAKPPLPVAMNKATIRALKRGTESGEVTYSDGDLLMLSRWLRSGDAQDGKGVRR